MTPKLTEDARIHEALELLNAVAADQKEQLREAISSRYNSLKEVVSEAGNHAGHRVQEIYAAGKTRATQAAHAVDENVHRNAWLYIGGTAVTALLLGYVLGRSSRRD